MTAIDLWAEMATDVAGESDGHYFSDSRWRNRICMTAEAFVSPDRAMVRYRTIEGHIRRKAGHPTLLDLSVGNLFSPASSTRPEPVHVVTDPRHAQWARHAGRVSLDEHVRLIDRFVGDLQDAGWALEQATLTPLSVAPPRVRNGQGEHPLPTEKRLRLVRRPATWPVRDMSIAIVAPDHGRADTARTRVTQALEAVFGRNAPWRPRVASAIEPRAGAVTLVLLDDRAQLSELHDLRAMLRKAESEGHGFKLAKVGSLDQPYPAQNIVYDLFLIAGGEPWVSAEPRAAFCSLDAGHDAVRRRSRWVKAECDAASPTLRIEAFESELAEHVPADLLPRLWPGNPEALLCRDGRLSQERAHFESRAAAEGRPLIEAKKSPTAILWRHSEAAVSPALFGDAVIDDHGDVLLQTVPQDARDYVHPVRLTIRGGDAASMSSAFLHQQAMPPISLFHMPRLPGPLYFADLVSKTTADGWPKAVGRGFRVPEIVLP